MARYQVTLDIEDPYGISIVVTVGSSIAFVIHSVDRSLDSRLRGLVYVASVENVPLPIVYLRVAHYDLEPS